MPTCRIDVKYLGVTIHPGLSCTVVIIYYAFYDGYLGDFAILLRLCSGRGFLDSSGKSPVTPDRILKLASETAKQNLLTKPFLNNMSNEED